MRAFKLFIFLKHFMPHAWASKIARKWFFSKYYHINWKNIKKGLDSCKEVEP
jgi:hypothetical protein